MEEWSGQAAIVTGAASGLGAAVTRELLSRGANVVLVDRDRDGLERIVGDLPEPGRARVFPCDVTDDDAPAAAVASAVEAFGRLDALITAAGIWRPAPFVEMSAADVDAQIAINLRAPFMFAQAAAPRLIEDGGAIVFFSSSADRRGFPGSSAYCASKGGVSALTYALASELGPLGVRVNAVAPGTVETAINSESLTDPSHRAAVVGATPLGRLGEPREIAEAVLYLASRSTSFTSGHVLVVDGAWSVS